MHRPVIRGLAACLALGALAAIPALGQWTGGGLSYGPAAPSGVVPSVDGIQFNDNGAGIVVAGVPWARFNNQVNGITGVILGKYAGVNLPAVQGTIAIGDLAMASATLGANETVVISPWGLPYAPSPHSSVFIGEHVAGTETAPTACTGIGADVMRDTTGCTGGTVLGSGAVIDGAFVDDTVIGSNSLHGTTGNVVIGPGTPHAGDVITVTLTSTDAVNNVGFPATVTYTVVGGDTTALLLAQHVHAAIDASAAVDAITYTKPAITNVPTRVTAKLVTTAGDYVDGAGNYYIAFHIDGTQTTGAKVTVAASCSGTCPNVVSATGASTPTHNTLVGRGVLANPGLADATFNVIVGHGAVPDGTGLANNVVVGANAGLKMTDDANNTVVGAYAGSAQVSADSNTEVGYYAGAGLTSGASNTFLGMNSGKKITTGSNNLCLGVTSCNNTVTTGNDNIILATRSAQGDTDASNRSNLISLGGLVKFQNQSLAAPAVSACGTSTIDANANNVAGTITFAGTPASCTVTFAGTGYRTFNHCVVTSEAVNANFAYSYTKTVLTITGTALAGAADYWCSGN